MLLRFASILLVSVACAWPQAADIPDTPAGHTLQAWLDAFNSGDRAGIQAYIAKYEPTGAVDETVGFRDQTGVLSICLVSTRANGCTSNSALMKRRARPHFLRRRSRIQGGGASIAHRPGRHPPGQLGHALHWIEVSLQNDRP